MRCSIDATSLRVNTAASGLIETESIPALTRNQGSKLNVSKSSLGNPVFSRGLNSVSFCLRQLYASDVHVKLIKV